MNITQQEWQLIGRLEGDELKLKVFDILREAALAVNSSSADDPKLLEVVPRLAELIPVREELRSYREAFSSLARATGLWNYIEKSTADTLDALLAETVTLPELGGVTLHREQVSALNDLFSGKNLILSAPTSFGKSLLIDALLASGKYKRVAIVLPTIALLDEFRRRLRTRFKDKFQVIMHPTDAATDGRLISLGTQERLLNRSDLGYLDLTVVDEFYKLDPGRRDERSVTLNAAVYKLLGRSKQFFFLGPNIDKVQISGEGRWRFEFLRTRFSTVAVDTFDLRQVPDKEARLLEEISQDENWPALVFVSSPDKANRLASEASEAMAVSDESSEFANWLRENVGKGWSVTAAVENGFGVHHGRLPRAIASQMVRMFNEVKLPVLFCTSTLIEGVNTAAKTVLIFDKAINRANYDFFTFSNIRGRAGRLGQHHVGKVFLFNDPPEQEAMEVTPTLFGDDEDAPDDYVVHLDEADVSAEIDDRMADLRESLGLDMAGLRLASSVGLEEALALKQHVAQALKNGARLVWRGSPKYHEVGDVIDVICKVKKASAFGVFTPNQLKYLLNSLRWSKTIKGFLTEYDSSYQGSEVSRDNVFKFLRACEYGLPQWFSVVQLFVLQSNGFADYNLFVRELSRWFRPEVLKNLDEEGGPIQISERFYRTDHRVALIDALTRAVESDSERLSEFEREWVAAALDIPRAAQQVS